MTRIFDETFEATGYDETWTGEVVGSGSTVNEDASTGDVSSPSGWGSQCLKLVTTGDDAAVYQEDGIGSPTKSFLRIEVVVTAESLANGEQNVLLAVYDSSWGEAYSLWLEQDGSGNLVFAAYPRYDTSNYASFSSDPISLNTRYRIEFKWDSEDDDEFEWRIDGVTQDVQALDTGHSPNIDFFTVGFLYNIDAAATAYIDLFAIDDADWVGAETADVTVSPGAASALSTTSGPTVSASLTISPDPAAAVAGTFSLYGVGPLTFEVAVDLDGDQDWSGGGEDLTGYVQGLDFSNGMSAAYQTLGKSQATLTLINVEGRFSPEHANALSGFTLGRVVRVRVSTAGGVVELFRGAITKIDPRAGGKGKRRCAVTCEGWLSRMRQQPFELPLQTSQRADQIAAAIIEAVGAYPPGYGSEDAYTHFETGVETFPYFADNLDDNARVYDALRVLAASEATGRFYQERDGRLRFWDRRYLMKRYAIQATFEDTMAEMDYAYGAEIRNQVVVKYHPRQYEGDGPYVLSTHDEGIKFRNAQEEKEIYLRYSDESDITVSTSDPITPERRVDFWGNNKEDGSGDLDFSGALSVSAEHFGTYSKWTVGNGGLSFWLAAGATQRGADRITDRGRQEVRRSDDESIASYGLHPHTIDTQAQPSHNVARALAYWTVGKFSQPRGEIKRLTIRPLRDAALRAQAVERQIGDRIKLKETQTGVDADYFIVGERWRVGEGAKEVEVSWVVEPAAVHQCLLLGVTGFCEMGSNSRMGY
jgi:hypothetical protein